MAKRHTNQNTTKELTKSKSSFTVDKYNNLLSGFNPNQLVSNQWEKRGGVYVQYSAFDETLVCTSTSCMN